MHWPREAGHSLGRTRRRPRRRKRMISMSCAPSSGDCEAVLTRDGGGRIEKPARKLQLTRLSPMPRGLFGASSSPLYWINDPASWQRVALFPSMKTCGSAAAASPSWREHTSAPLFPYSKNFCTRLTGSRAPPSIARSSGSGRVLAKDQPTTFEGGARAS